MKTSALWGRLGLALALCAAPAFAAPVDWSAADAKVAAAATPLDKINALYQKAGLPFKEIYPERADLVRAAKALDEALELVRQQERNGKLTGLGGFYFRRARLAQLLERPDEAVRFYDRAEKEGYLSENANVENKGSELLANRAESRAALYDFAGALADLDRAIALKEVNGWVKKRAFIRFDKGDWEGAVADWKRLIELAPYEKLREDYVAASLDGPVAPSNEIILPFDRKLLGWNAAIAANPRDPAPFRARARYRAQKALRQYSPLGFERALKLDFKPDEKELLEAASRDWTRLTELDAKDAEAWRERGALRSRWWMAQRGAEAPFDAQEPLEDLGHALYLQKSDVLARLETGLYLSNRAAPRAAATSDERKSDLRAATMNFSRAILLAPDASADARFQRTLIERAKEKPDPHALWEDYSAILKSDLQAIGTPASDWQRADVASEAHRMRGKILLGQGQNTAALAEFSAAIEAGDRDGYARFDRGKLRVVRGDYDGALDDLGAMNSAEALLWRAAAHDGKGETDKAKTVLAGAIARDAKIAQRVRGTRYDAANPTPKPLAPAPVVGDVPVVPTGSALEHKNRGNQLVAQGDEAGALAEYSAAILIDPKFADAYNNRGGRYLAQKKYDLALADLNRAIELDPKHRIAYANRATLWDELGENEKKLADLDRAVEFVETPAHRVSALTARALARLDAKNQGGALADIERARSLATQDDDSWNEIADAQLYLAQYAAAAQSYTRVTELKPTRTRAILLRAVADVLAKTPGADDALGKALAQAQPDDVNYAKSVVASLRRRNDGTELRALAERLG